MMLMFLPLMLGGGKHTIAKSVPLRESIWAEWSNSLTQRATLCLWTGKIFSHAQKRFGFSRRSRVLLQLTCLAACSAEEMQHLLPADEEVTIWSRPAFLDCFNSSKTKVFCIFWASYWSQYQRGNHRQAHIWLCSQLSISRFQCWSRWLHSKQPLSWPRLINCPHVLDS